MDACSSRHTSLFVEKTLSALSQRVMGSRDAPSSCCPLSVLNDQIGSLGALRHTDSDCVWPSLWPSPRLCVFSPRPCDRWAQRSLQVLSRCHDTGVHFQKPLTGGSLVALMSQQLWRNSSSRHTSPRGSARCSPSFSQLTRRKQSQTSNPPVLFFVLFSLRVNM